MIKKISIKTKFGWISVFEEKGKIFRIKYGKIKKQQQSYLLKNFKSKLNKFLNKKTIYLNAPHKLEGNKIQKQIWNELKRIKFGQTKNSNSVKF